MTFTGYLLQLSFTLLSNTLPLAAVLYVVIRLAVKHGLSDAAKIARVQPQSISGHRGEYGVGGGSRAAAE